MKINKKILIIVVISITIGLIVGLNYYFQFIKFEINTSTINKEQVEQQESLKEKGGALKELNEGLCKSLIPSSLSDLAAEEYYTFYHIDGSMGDSIKWISSSQPPEEPFLLNGPELYFVYSEEKLEGCGFREKIKEEEIELLKSKLEQSVGLPKECGERQFYSSQEHLNSYLELELFVIEDNKKMERIVRLFDQRFDNIEQVLSIIGCEYEI